MNDFQTFPQIQTLLDDERLKAFPHAIKAYFAKKIVKECKKNKEFLNKNALILKILNALKEYEDKDFKPLINATGVVIHTNLGRSIFDEELFKACQKNLCSYTNLEFNLKNGKRGSRYDAVLEKLKILFECEDALIVNNNASAVFLVLNSLAFNKEVLSSRGELVEIGGNFRIPEVIKAAGVKLKELGTSNKTHLKDYENAITKESAILLKTHKSNFTLKGFCEEVGIKELGILAKKKRLISYYDLGSGWCGKLPKNLSIDEPELKKLVKQCDVLSFSGDKLFGSAQAGIILGKKKLIAKLRQNQLLRMLRIDKLSLVFLNESLKAYLQKEYDKIPTLKLLNDDLEQIKQKALKVQKRLKFKSLLKASKSLVGGGSLPDKSLKSFVLAFEGNALKMQEIFRKQGIIARIEDKNLVLDFRSIKENELERLINLINEMENKCLS
ncbi:L-seryl-tRNA(Sec) selenium transferase [Campylobacter upsaliensis]|uniref:L-seryl-tRNA(Sec) selenium transferase n=1 Tax=Campylobacter upsaliensis TaxID=28080 RepID=UPI001284960A|nr:L-seryl-tRNA(Sec) selenium transferase [Campylobacter upsaliensis]EAH8539586.1 L-seryl-tRNA(Sec) selenium transferase [Campylobacter upsaliensis]EAI4357026.1 L-seryl-tRNA(Sec) selenium transferase [Campylobacter upsaliensis]EAI5397221.1 L-seryl-tRNA(Sec) selenium transferase [Campylobacter upsaliensis]EAI5622776.1 L-seryl-tRNA(Sec) selenium transferase [Campylobacter upsaliensis]EAI7243551.1 L-seryl-tRNA(Sec) selenium transferase [Campylobacter upsaliensis]